MCADKEHFNIMCFEGWQLKLLNVSIDNLKMIYGSPRNVNSLFKDPIVKSELEYFHMHFVICPVDKANKNIAIIICKRFYVETLLNGCMENTLSYSQIKDSDIDNICDEIEFLWVILLNCHILLCFRSSMNQHFFNVL